MKTTLYLFLLLIISCSPKLTVYPEKSADLVYKQINSTTLHLYIINPSNFNTRKTYPVFIFFYGGGWVNGDINQFERQAKYFASRGLVTVLADYRTAKKNNTTPFEAVRDAKSAIRYLRIHADSLHINPAKIIAGGGSAGAHLAAAADLTQLEDKGENLQISSRPNALVLYNPVFDNGPDGYGYERIGNRYPEISPLHNIKAGAAPTIVFLGTKDKLVPVATAELYKKKMKEAGNRCDLFTYQDQQHGFFNSEAYFYKTVKEADIFLTSLGYLKGKPKITEQTFTSIHSEYGKKSN